jgi:Golgi SNAP receptor complex protein 1
MSRAIQRHGEVYQDYAKELRRTKVCPVSMLREPNSHDTLQTNIQHALDKVNLLSGVRNDIE